MSKLNVVDRNAAAKEYVCKKISLARTRTIDDFSYFKNNNKINELLDDLICVKANGFRGVVLTAIVGLYIDNTYDPINSFYSCNPRAIFENGIWYALNENGVPCGKSDPLNVAKNINELNYSWANGRRPQKSARAAVDFLDILVNKTARNKKDKLIDYFFFKLAEYAKAVQSIEISADCCGNISKQEIASKLIDFALRYPESGTIPQMIIGMLINQISCSADFVVGGCTESVFGTNTTSKKPADIWISENDILINLYEVTVKKIDLKRLDDCLDSLRKLEILDIPITFICRIPEDVRGLKLTRNTFMYKGKPFDFVDISSFVSVTISLIEEKKLLEIINQLQNFVQNVNRPIITKIGWNEIFGDPRGRS